MFLICDSPSQFRLTEGCIKSKLTANLFVRSPTDSRPGITWIMYQAISRVLIIVLSLHFFLQIELKSPYSIKILPSVGIKYCVSLLQNFVIV